MSRVGYFDLIKTNRLNAVHFIVNYGVPRFSEIDRYNILLNSQIINYFEDATGIFMSSLIKDGVIDSLQEKGVSVAIYDYAVKMRSPIRPKDEMSIALRPTSFKFGLLEFEQSLMVNGKVKAHGRINHVLVEAKTMARVYPIPDFIQKEIDNVFRVFKEQEVYVRESELEHTSNSV